MAQHIEGGDPLLTNEDLVPTPVEKRRWNEWHFTALWMGLVNSAFGFAVLGGMMATGLSAMQALVTVFAACLLQMGLLGLTGRVGSRFGIPFAVWARSTFGTFGANIPAFLRAVVAIGWFGVQSYLGATATNAMLGAVWGWWRSLDTELWGVGINLWIAMLLYWGINLLVIRHGMETIRRFEAWAGPALFVVLVPMVVWAVGQAGGLGPVFGRTSQFSTGEFLATRFVPGIALFVSASWATMVLNYPDITRHASSNRAQLKGVFLGLPLATVVFYGMSAVIVSGTQAATGQALWNPADVLVAIGNPVLTVLGALAIMFATLSTNLAANLISPAFDFTNILPRHLNFRRSAVLAILISFAFLPWKLMENETTLFTVLNNVGAVTGPATGILLADFYVVRRQRLDVDALFRRHGRYRYQRGFNLPVIGLLLATSLLCIAGQFVPALSWAYTYSSLLGILFGFVAYLVALPLLRRLAPAEAYEIAGSLGQEHDAVADGAPTPQLIRTTNEG